MTTQIAVQQGFVNVDGGKLYYETAGSGDETVVFCHAAFLDSGMWDAQWPVFAEHYRVVRYDMRGFGKSDAVNAPIERRADLLALLDHLELDQVHLIAASMSGTVALDFTLEHPERVRSLVTVGSAAGGDEPQGEPPAKILELIEATQRGDKDRANELQIQIWYDGPYREAEQMAGPTRDHAKAMNRRPVELGTFMADMEPKNPLNPPAVQRLGEIKVPVLATVGALDFDVTVESTRRLGREIEHAQVWVIPETAHVPNLEVPDEFNRVVLEFLAKV